MLKRSRLILLIHSFDIIILFTLSCTINDNIVGADDHDGPILNVLSSIPTQTVSSQINIAGNVSDANGIDSIIINHNGTKIPVVNTNQSFSQPISLVSGMNVIAIFAMDNSANHNVSSDTLIINKLNEYQCDGISLSISGPLPYSSYNAPWNSNYSSKLISTKIGIQLSISKDDLYRNFSRISLRVLRASNLSQTDLKNPAPLMTDQRFLKAPGAIVNEKDTSFKIFNCADSVEINTNYYYIIKCTFKDTSTKQTVDKLLGPYHYNFWARNYSHFEFKSNNDSIEIIQKLDTNARAYCFIRSNLTPQIDSFFSKVIPTIIHADDSKYKLLRVGTYQKLFVRYGIFKPEYNFGSPTDWISNLKDTLPFSYGKNYPLYCVSVNSFGDMVIDSIMIKGPTLIEEGGQYKLFFPNNETDVTLKKEFSPYKLYFTANPKKTNRNVFIEGGCVIDEAFFNDSSLSIISVNNNNEKILIKKTFQDQYLDSVNLSNTTIVTAYRTIISLRSLKLVNCNLLHSVDTGSDYYIKFIYTRNANINNCNLNCISLCNKGDTSHTSYITSSNLNNSLILLGPWSKVDSSILVRCSLGDSLIYIANCKCNNCSINPLKLYSASTDFSNSSFDIDQASFSNSIIKNITVNAKTYITINSSSVLNSYFNLFRNSTPNKLQILNCDIVINNKTKRLSALDKEISGLFSTSDNLIVSDSKIFSTLDTTFEALNNMHFNNNQIVLGNNQTLAFSSYTKMDSCILNSNIISGSKRMFPDGYKFKKFKMTNNTFFKCDSFIINLNCPKLFIDHCTIYHLKYCNIFGAIDTFILINSIYNGLNINAIDPLVDTIGGIIQEVATFDSCNISNCSFPDSVKYQTKDCIFGDPKVEVRENGVFLLDNSPLLNKGSDGKNIGTN
jgi:hypothetical protein